MKQLLIVSMALLALCSPVRAQWEWTNAYYDSKAIIFLTHNLSASGSYIATIARKTTTSPLHVDLVYIRSNDGGKNWVTSRINTPNARGTSGGLRICQIDSLYAFAAGDSGLVIRTTDAGTSWSLVNSPGTGNIRCIHFSDRNNGILSIADSMPIYTTSNGGATWVLAPLASSYLWQCYTFGPGRYFVCQYGVGPIYRTSDYWHSIDSTARIYDPSNNGGDNRLFVGCVPTEGDTLIAYGVRHVGGATAGLIYRSTDDGVSWQEPFDAREYSIGVSNISNIGGDTLIADGQIVKNSILRSVDRGLHWIADSLPYSQRKAEAAWCLGASTGYNGSLVLLLDGSSVFGDAWIANGTPVKANIEAYERIIYSTRVYPNPARESTVLSAVHGYHRVVVRDVMGRSIIDDRTAEDGTLKFNVKSLPNGIYFVHLDYEGLLLPVGKLAVQR